jgi:hypothetical protein
LYEVTHCFLVIFKAINVVGDALPLGGDPLRLLPSTHAS